MNIGMVPRSERAAVLAQVSIELLPASLHDIIEIIDVQPTLLLVQHFGGTYVDVPAVRDCTPEHILARLIGFDLMLKLAAVWANDRLNIPKAQAALRLIRNQQIHAHAAAGKTQRELCMMYGLTERQINTILNGQPPEDRQTDLF